MGYANRQTNGVEPMPKSPKDQRRARCDSSIRACLKIEENLKELFMEVAGRDEQREEMLKLFIVVNEDLMTNLEYYRKNMT